MKILLILVVLFFLVIVILGVALIKGAWQPIKDENGDKVELTDKQRKGVKYLIAGAVIGLFALFLTKSHRWVKKMNASVGRK